VAGGDVTRRARGTLQALVALTAGVALPVQAHLVETGFGAFYDGFAHVVLTPADLLLIIGLALLVGQRGTQAARWAVVLLPLAWLAGGLLGRALPLSSTWPALTTLTFAIAGALVALNARLPNAVVAVAVVLAAALHGIVNGATMAPGGAALLGIAGAVAAAACLFTILAAQVSALQAGWTRVAVRVGGSWVAAAGVLMLGWLARSSV
jgi:hydrogenase/urease accessory protein HupE